MNAEIFLFEIFSLLGVLILLLLLIFFSLYLAEKKSNFTIFYLEVCYFVVFCSIALSLIGVSWNAGYILGAVFDTPETLNAIIVFKQGAILFFELICLVVLISLTIHTNTLFRIPEYFIVLLVLFFGFTLLVSTEHLTIGYLSLEVIGLCSYILAAGPRTRKSLEAALKYFSFSALSSGFFLLGVLNLYFITGHITLSNLRYFLNLTDLSNIEVYIIGVGILLSSIGLFLKFTAVPFHSWAVDVYQGISQPVLFLFMLLPKFAIGCFLLEFSQLINFLSGTSTQIGLTTFFLICSGFSFIVGTVGALQAETLQKFLAYTGISHVGFVLLGLANFSGNASAVLYLICYFILMFIFFVLLFELRKQNFRVVYLRDLRNLYAVHPVIAIYFAMTLFSMAGVPPFLGFMAKYYILCQALDSQFYFVCLLGVLTSIVSCFYYIRLIKIMFFESKFTHFSFLSADAVQTNYSSFFVLLFANLFNIAGIITFTALLDTVVLFFLIGKYLL